ncbi:MAG: methylmalonyl-CoA epimerase [Acidobacteria bacterium]|jgi:methylmalonyl-CoA/ethylmalonyl-CoA epimerase|nr:methylmalonyl-CoA epimerase [Acidobacteriota bacterium]
MKGKVLGLDHVGVAVRDPRQRLPLWAEVLGLPLDRAEAVPTEGVRTWFLDFGGGHIELLEPLSDDSPIARAIEKRGEGIHHLCLAVDDLEAALARLAARGIEPLGGGARPGAGGCTVAFLHPKDTGGVLLELSQRPPGAPAHGAAEVAAHPFAPGALAVLYAKDPRARMVGVIRALDAVGVTLAGLDLDAWEDWVAQWSRGERGPLTPSLQFYPIARVEKLQADEDAPDLPSFGRRFAERTGLALSEALAGGDGRR